MNYNIAAYILFLLLMIFIIAVVGRHFYKNGRVFIISLMNGNVALADQINRLLLIGYYLFNIGYAFVRLKHWQSIPGIEMMLLSVSLNMGVLILLLGFMHYFNMLVIYYLSKRKSITQTNKTFQL